MSLLKVIATGLFIALAGCSGSSGTSDGKGKGDEGPNGGDSDVQQAQLVVQDVVVKVSRMPEVFPEVNLTDLQNAAGRVRIIGRPKTYANGVETDATNDGATTIELNLSRWKRMNNHDRKLALIFHELLGIMGLERNNYAISSRILVESRFAATKEYNCQSTAPQSSPCKIRLGYSSAQGRFLVQDINCGSFPNPVLTMYSYYYGSYSAYGECDDRDMVEDALSSCTNQAAPGNVWAGLTFSDGYEFYFEGAYQQVLSCSR